TRTPSPTMQKNETPRRPSFSYSEVAQRGANSPPRRASSSGGVSPPTTPPQTAASIKPVSPVPSDDAGSMSIDATKTMPTTSNNTPVSSPPSSEPMHELSATPSDAVDAGMSFQVYGRKASAALQDASSPASGATMATPPDHGEWVRVLHEPPPMDAMPATSAMRKKSGGVKMEGQERKVHL
ncbi:hypothetical protein BC829DRAFT_398219, partial [Chytridium lagenaria]